MYPGLSVTIDLKARDWVVDNAALDRRGRPPSPSGYRAAPSRRGSAVARNGRQEQGDRLVPDGHTLQSREPAKAQFCSGPAAQLQFQSCSAPSCTSTIVDKPAKGLVSYGATRPSGDEYGSFLMSWFSFGLPRLALAAGDGVPRSAGQHRAHSDRRAWAPCVIHRCVR